MNDPDTQHLDSQHENIWTVYRIDDNGNTFVVRERLTRDEAKRLVVEFEARGHKQMYWAEEKRM
jgi:UDP-N-acetyl-2-amino-2-deoxyglucuronate dehydrogenase